MGIRECSYMGVPVVNIGTRQNDRERGPNVIDVKNDRCSIKKPYNSTLIMVTMRVLEFMAKAALAKKQLKSC